MYIIICYLYYVWSAKKHSEREIRSAFCVNVDYSPPLSSLSLVGVGVAGAGVGVGSVGSVGAGVVAAGADAGVGAGAGSDFG